MSTIAEGIFTESQRIYVESIDDSMLRPHLLHQVRLRDNMESDRNSFEREVYTKSQIIQSKDQQIKELTELVVLSNDIFTCNYINDISLFRKKWDTLYQSYQQKYPKP